VNGGDGGGGGEGAFGIIAITLVPPKIPPINKAATERKTQNPNLTGVHWTMCSEHPVPSTR